MAITVETMAKLFEENGYRKIAIEMFNNDMVYITPVGGYGEVKTLSDVEWFLMDSTGINLCGGSTLDYVVGIIDRYKEFVDEHDRGVEYLKKHVREYGYNSDWDFVSDYHKDLFGHRPHVGQDNVIRWAYSTSKDSARVYTNGRA